MVRDNRADVGIFLERTGQVVEDVQKEQGRWWEMFRENRSGGGE